MVSEIRVIRDRKGGTGTLSYTHNGINIGDIKIRTGAANQLENSEWLRGISGIPIGDFWLWNKKGYIQQPNDLDATEKEIGRFYPLSTYAHDHRTIWNQDKSKKREEIGLHDENGIKGSAGCVVVILNPLWRVLCKHLDDTPEGLITFRTRWRQ
jgi:hypothetical protein